MQAGIEAVMDAVAPPVRAAQDASVPADAPSFDDHLEAAEAEAAAPDIEADEPDAEVPSTDQSDPDAVAQTQPQPAPQQQNFAAAAIALQVVEAVDTAATSPGDAAVGDVEAAPPPQSAPPSPAAPIETPAPIAAKRSAETATNQAPSTEAELAAQADNAPDQASLDAAPPINKDSAAADDAAQRAPQSQSAPSATSQQAQTAQTNADAPPPIAPVIAPIAAKPSAPVKAETKPEAPVANAPSANAPTNAPAEKASAFEPATAEPTDKQTVTAASERDVQKPAAPRDSFTAPPPSQQQAQSTLNQAIPLSPAAPSVSSSIQTLTPHAAAPAAAQVTREIIRKFDGANTRFELRLDPPELGRVEVKLEVSRDHRVTAIVAADSPQALAELTRHARDIEQALQSSGLELSDEGLSFDLSQHRQNLNDDSEHQSGARAQQTSPQDQTPVSSRALTLDAWRGARVDLVA